MDTKEKEFMMKAGELAVSKGFDAKQSLIYARLAHANYVVSEQRQSATSEAEVEALKLVATKISEGMYWLETFVSAKRIAPRPYVARRNDSDLN